MKLVALGDSIIKGVLVQSEGERSRYSLADRNILDRFACGLCPDTAFEPEDVVNLGKMGCTIEAGERILNRFWNRLSGARYVLLEYGGNDSDYDWQSIAEHPEIEHHPRTRLEVFEQAYERVVNKIKQLGAVPLVLSLPPMDAERYFAFFSAPFSEKGRQNVLNWLGGTTNTIMSGHELYNLATMRVAQRTGAQWVDVTSVMLKERNLRAYLCDDGIHPNELGQSKIAEAVLGALS